MSFLNVVGSNRIIRILQDQIKIMNQKKCLECSTPIIGRIDKKFCSDYCRNSYNNKVNTESKNLIRNTNNRLKKNYKILSELNISGKTKVTRSKLNNYNYDFNYFTSIYTTKTGNIYHYVYDQGYLALENDYFLLYFLKWFYLMDLTLYRQNYLVYIFLPRVYKYSFINY